MLEDISRAEANASAFQGQGRYPSRSRLF